MNKIIRLTEQDLHNIVRESVNRILKEARSSEYETTAQQQERLNKKGGKRDFGKYGEKKAQEYETTAQQQERLKKKGLREGWADDLCQKMKGAPGTVGNPRPQGKSEFAVPSWDELTPEELEFVKKGVNGMGRHSRLCTVRDARRSGMTLGEYLNNRKG